ncbi:MAG TPA: SMC-Scp complex subunit ScpB [Acidobacteriaceae bacterium]|nr:SMC-Scp complex subunit ScpB [Acidobacteriaceae bacterium]
MSLKARIEAVIYAAEEPVTLAALASLFRDEALALRAERAAAESPAATPELPIAGEAAMEDAEREAQSAERAVSAGGEVPAETVAEDATPAEDEKKDARQRDREARDEIRRLVDELRSDYATADRGLEIREVAGGYRMATRAEYHDAVRAFIKTLKPPMKLSLQALETLAVIAYKQPVTAPEIGEIRGVDTSGVLGSLIARKLITTAGRKQVLGRPILYRTTKEFLLRFGLKDLNELPSMEEFEKMAGELAEAEEESAVQTAEGDLLFAEDEAVEQAADEVCAEEAAEPPTSVSSVQDPALHEDPQP